MVGTKTINYTKSCLLWSLWPWSWIKCSIKLLKFLHYCPLQRQPNTMNMIRRPRLDAILSIFVTVHPHETSILLHSSSCFFFVSLPLPSHSTLIHSFTFITYYIYIYIYYSQFSLNWVFVIFWALDLERLLRAASFAWWWCNLIGHIKPAGSLCGVLGAYFDCCASFHFHFLFV